MYSHDENSEFDDIKFFNLDQIGPSDKNYTSNSKLKPTKIVLIGKPGTGKTSVIKSILYHFRRRINQGIIMSATDDVSADFHSHFPALFIYDYYDEKPLSDLILHQKKNIQEQVPNPWSVLIIDDCAYDRKFFNSPIQQQLFKNSRHWYILYVLSLQSPKDIPPSIRACIDGVFIFREHNKTIRKSIYDNYASIIPTFSLFNKLMDKYTQDFGALFINNRTCSNNWQDCVQYYRGTPIERKWKFGNSAFWQYNSYYLNSGNS